MIFAHFFIYTVWKVLIENALDLDKYCVEYLGTLVYA